MVNFRSSITGPDCDIWFAKKLQKLAYKINTMAMNPLAMKLLTADEIITFNQSTHCHICKKPFLPTDIKAKDHCCLHGTYRGTSHISCNYNYTDEKFIPVVFHNLSGYDSHFIIKALST